MMDESDLYQFLVENVNDGVYIVDRDRTITAWNRGATAMTGFTRDDVIGRQCRDGILNHVDESGRTLCGQYCPLEATMRDGQSRKVHIWMNRADGTRLPVAVRATPVRDDDGTIVGAMEVFTDDTPALNEHAWAEKLARTKLTDPLTGLGDHRYLEFQLASFCTHWTQNDWPFGLIELELSYLEAIRAEYGEAVGDRALKLVAGTMVRTLTQIAVVSRTGDNRFTVLQPCGDGSELRKIAERVRRMIAVSRLTVDGTQIRLVTTIGYAMVDVGDSPTAVRNRTVRALELARSTPHPPGRDESCPAPPPPAA